MIDLGEASADLAGRLGLPAASELTDRLVVISWDIISPRIGPNTADTYSDIVREAIVQLGLRIADAGARTTQEPSELGSWAPPAAASWSLWRSVAGLLSPCLPRGGAVIG